MKRIILIIIHTIILVSCFIRCSNDNPDYNNWITIYQNDSLDLISIKFLDEDNGFIIAEYSGIHGDSDWKFVLSTEDAGKTWSKVTCSSFDTIDQFPLYDIIKIFPISKNTLLATGYNLHRSYDKGKNWRNVTHQLNGPIINDVFIADSITWIVATGTQIKRTNDGGDTWQTVFQTDFPGVFGQFSFSSSNIGYITLGLIDMDQGVSTGLILKTDNCGQTWTLLEPEPWKSNKISIPFITVIQFINNQTGYISTYGEYKLYKTTDAGNSWISVGDNNISNGLEFFISVKDGYNSNGASIYSTNNGGRTWEIDYYNSDPNSDILTWSFLDTGVGYSLTRNHKVLKRIYL